MPRRPPPPPKPDWLSRALARAGVMPLDEAEAAIRSGRVTVGGRRVTQPLTLVRPGERVCVDGAPVDLGAETIALMFFKPSGSVTAPEDPEGQPTVFELLQGALPPELSRYGWHAIGRLDRGTTGLLLFTNDERLVAHVTHPERHLPKRYLATVSGTVDEPKLERLRRGIELDGRSTRPARVRVRAPGQLEVTLTEGRFHQVKRMLGAVGLPVLALHREAVGGIVLDLTQPGSWRRLSPQELTDGLGFSATQR